MTPDGAVGQDDMMPADVRMQKVSEKTTWRLEELRGALVIPVAVQIILLVFTSMLLDGGFTSPIVMAAAGGH
jgi:hypothetical protein